VSNLVRYRTFSTGLLSNVFDNLASTVITYNSTSYHVVDGLLFFASPESVSTFTVDYHLPIYRHGFQISKNEMLLYTDAPITRFAGLP